MTDQMNESKLDIQNLYTIISQKLKTMAIQRLLIDISLFFMIMLLY